MLDYTSLKSGFNKIKVGTLTAEIISALGLPLSPVDIILWGDRLEHIEKHKKDFNDEQSFINCFDKIPEIISSPDYVGIHPRANSIEYIKRVDALTLVAVRIRPKGSLAVRTVFPLTEAQLSDYLRMGTIKKL